MPLVLNDLVPNPAIVFIFTCTLVLSIFGNIYIILSIISSKYMKSVTNIFIGSKSISDLMAGSFMSMFTLLQNIQPNRPRGHTCEPPVFVELTCVSASIFSILAVGVDRYLAVLHPTLKYITPKKAFSLVLTIWIISALYSLRLIAQFRYTKYEMCKMFFDEKYNEEMFRAIDFSCLFVMPMAVMSFMYYRIGIFLWKKGSVTSTVLRKRKVVKFLVVTLVLFCVSWGPFYVLDMRHLAFSHTSGPLHEHTAQYVIIRFVFIVMAICNGFLTPLVYVIYFPHTRLETKKALAVAIGLRSKATSMSSWSKILCIADADLRTDLRFPQSRPPFTSNTTGGLFYQHPAPLLPRPSVLEQ